MTPTMNTMPQMISTRRRRWRSRALRARRPARRRPDCGTVSVWPCGAAVSVKPAHGMGSPTSGAGASAGCANAGAAPGKLAAAPIGMAELGAECDGGVTCQLGGTLVLGAGEAFDTTVLA